MGTRITCYGGVNEIGGNKLLLEDGEQRYLLDFGVNFNKVGMYYNEFLRPRTTTRGLLDPLLLGLIPPLRGIYRPDIESENIWQRAQKSLPLYRDLRRDEGSALDAVFLSHAHLDHNGDISYLDPSIPIITSKLSGFISRVLQVTGAKSLEREMVYANPRMLISEDEFAADRKANYQLRPHRFYDGPLSPEAEDFWLNAGEGTKAIDDFMQSLQYPPMLSNIYIFFPVDHSIPGASGLAVQTTSGWVGYTGDIRFHGKNGALTTAFGEALAGLKLKALLCEGTHPDPSEAESLKESDVADRAVEIIERYAGQLVIADFAARSLERLMTFLSIASETERMMLVQPKDIYLLEACALADPEQYQSALNSPSLGMLTDPKSAPKGWEKGVRRQWRERNVSHREVSEDPGRYILAMSLWDLNDLPDLEGIDGGAYLFSNSKAYDDEQKADLERMRAWIRWIGMDIYGDPDDLNAMSLHSSGHAGYHELVDFVKTVKPEILIPVHTENPAWWVDALAGTGIEIRMPEVGVPIAL